MLNLKPEEVWSHFEKISEIPRCSGNEEGIKNYIIEAAAETEMEVKEDEVGNVLLESKRRPNVILQAHMDMVCEKNSEVEHDFKKDPIRLKEEDGWLTAKGTTLGADNGIGVALALAVATGNHTVDSVDCLFTVDEERGLNGAANLEVEFIRGDKLLNLDGEEFGVFTIGCAGGGKTTVDLPIDYEVGNSRDRVKISVKGLVGGHSGGDIDKGRANSIKLLTRLLKSLENNSLNLVEISGGDKHNAIPREASAVISVEKDYSATERTLTEKFSELKGEYSKTEPGMNLEVKKIPEGGGQKRFNAATTRALINLILALPNGVMAYEKDLDSTVETSTNLASVKVRNNTVRVLMSSRSTRESKLENLRKNRIEAIGEAFGSEVTHHEAYPAWQPDEESKLLDYSRQVFRDIYGENPGVKVVHGGLETGIIGEKKENIEMISAGPEIESPHSPEERMNIKSVENFWRFLLALLRELSEAEESGT
ncbi:MAG: beta-Ala-His dipeptidase [Candidatus Bipolaricaulia bacterium]